MNAKQSKALDKLMEAAETLGWCVAVKDENVTNGLIMGTEEFINELAGDEYEVWDLSKSEGPVDPESMN